MEEKVGGGGGGVGGWGSGGLRYRDRDCKGEEKVGGGGEMALVFWVKELDPSWMGQKMGDQCYIVTIHFAGLSPRRVDGKVERE